MTIIASLLRNAQLPDSPTARLDAELLLAAALGKSRSYLHTWPSASSAARPPRRSPATCSAAARRAGGLHPGPAGLLEARPGSGAAHPDPAPGHRAAGGAALELVPATPAQVLDLGTGTGAIALALASERPAWQVTAVDRVDEAVALAERNRQRLGLGNAQIRAAIGSMPGRSALRPDHQQPALHRAADPHLVAGDVRFEPSSALVAGEDGLDDLRVIVAQAPQHLLPGGWLLLEHGYDQAAAVRELLAASGFIEVASRVDLGGHERISLGRLPC
jgi:release factor glutamine methyltransferase